MADSKPTERRLLDSIRRVKSASATESSSGAATSADDETPTSEKAAVERVATAEKVAAKAAAKRTFAKKFPVTSARKKPSAVVSTKRSESDVAVSAAPQDVRPLGRRVWPD